MSNSRLLLAPWFALMAIAAFVCTGQIECGASGLGVSQLDTGDLSGTILDESGAVVPGVSIKVIQIGTGLQRRAITSNEGGFVIPFLPPGDYALTAEVPGFDVITINDIAVHSGLNSSVQIVLRPKPVSESMDVTASNAVEAQGVRIDISNATRKYSVTSEQAADLPIFTSDVGRNLLGTLPFLVPGVSPTTVTGSARSTTNLFGDQMSVNGARPSSAGFSIAGGDWGDGELGGAASPMPNPDALRELTVTTNNYTANLGKAAGGLIDATVKSGGERYSGNIRAFLTNEALDARGFFDPRVPLDRVTTYGGQIGGPLVFPGVLRKGHVFFFADYEGTRSDRETSPDIVVPSVRERVGDFSHSLGVFPVDPLTGRAFPGGIIPAGRIDPLSEKYLSLYVPLPNEGERNFRWLLPASFRSRQITARTDATISPRDSLSIVFYLAGLTESEGTTSLPVGSRIDSTGQSWSLVLHETHVISARVVNVVAASVNRNVSSQRSFAPGASGVSPSAFGFSGIRPQTDTVLSPPAVLVNGTDLNISGAFDSLDAKTTWQIKDDLSTVQGRNGLKVGAEVRSYAQTGIQSNDNGSFIFPGFSPNSSLAYIPDFLLGTAFDYSQSTGSSTHPRQHSFYAYAMDDLRLRPNLTLNLGLRYELAPPFTDVFDHLSAFRAGQKSLRFPNAPEGLVFPGDPDPILGRVPRGLYPTYWKNLAPRFGFAYSPEPSSALLSRFLGQHKTAIRVGWGVFYDSTLGQVVSSISLTQPFFTTQTLDVSQVQQAGGTFSNPFGSGHNPWPLTLGSTFVPPIDLSPVDSAYRTPYTYHYNLTIQRELPGSTLLEIAYVGANSFRVTRQRQINTAKVIPGANAFNDSDRRIYPNFDQILSEESSGRARYDSLQVNVRRRFSHRTMIEGSYTYAKALDNAPLWGADYTSLQWARSPFDRRHNFVMSFSHELSYFKASRFAARVFNNWTVAGIGEYRSGLPMNIFQLGDSTLAGGSLFGSPDLIGPYVALDPRKEQRLVVNGTVVDGHFFFNPSAFRAVTVSNYSQARPGTLGRNMLDGPALGLWSASLIKRFHIGDRHEILIRTDVKNLLNHANFDAPSTMIDNAASFGQVLSAAPGRNLQMSIKYSF